MFLYRKVKLIKARCLNVSMRFDIEMENLNSIQINKTESHSVSKLFENREQFSTCSILSCILPVTYGNNKHIKVESLINITGDIPTFLHGNAGTEKTFVNQNNLS